MGDYKKYVLSLPECLQSKIANEDNLWKCVEDKQEYIPFLPPRITFITSKRCNLSCRFCYHFRHKYMFNVSPLNMPVMDPRLVHKVAFELFPTLQYYETTLLGDPFLSPHLETEIELASKYHLYMRPTTNGTTLTDQNLDLVSGHMDWLKCSFDSHIRGVYNSIRIGARFENTIRKLHNFNKRRESMNPKPYFRMGLVLNDLNLEEIPDYFVWCHEYMGVDDVEIMGLNVDADHIESIAVFDKPKIVNKVMDKLIETALTKKYKLRLDFTQMPTPKGDRFVCQKRSAELREQQKQYGFIPPKDFEKMSYVMQNPRNRWEIGDVGYVWSNNMRDQRVCIEFMNRPFILDNGNVEVCGNCNTFTPGNLKKETFSQIWNNRIYRYIRRKMYEGTIKKDWPDACNDCICMGVTYDRGRSDHRHKPFYRVIGLDENFNEQRVSIGETHQPREFDVQYDNISYINDLKALDEYEHVQPATDGVYVSDLNPQLLRTVQPVSFDKVNIFTPLLLDNKVFSKGIFVVNENVITISVPENMSAIQGHVGFFDNLNPNRKVLKDKGFGTGAIDVKISANGQKLWETKLDYFDKSRFFDISLPETCEVVIDIKKSDPGNSLNQWIVLGDLNFKSRANDAEVTDSMESAYIHEVESDTKWNKNFDAEKLIEKFSLHSDFDTAPLPELVNLICYSWRDSRLNEETLGGMLKYIFDFNTVERDVRNIQESVPLKDALVLDTGCCWSSLGLLLQKHTSHLYGIDQARAHAVVSKIRVPCMRTYIGDVREMPFSSNYFEVVTSRGVIEHIGDYSKPRGRVDKDNYSEKLNYLAECYRVLKPGGYLWLATGNYDALYNGEDCKFLTHWLDSDNFEQYLKNHNTSQDHYWLLTWDQMEDMFTEVGFTLEKVSCPDPASILKFRKTLLDSGTAPDLIELLSKQAEYDPHLMDNWFMVLRK